MMYVIRQRPDELGKVFDIVNKEGLKFREFI
jgi:hypothetical protein